MSSPHSFSSVEPEQIPTVGGRIIAGGLWVALAKVSSAFLGVAIVSIVVRVLDQGAAGSYFVLISLAAIGAVVASLGVGKAVTRFIGVGIERGDSSASPIVRRGCFIVGIGTAMVIAVLTVAKILGVSALADEGEQVGWYVVVAWCAIMAIGAFRIVVTESFRGLSDIRRAAVWSETIPNLLMLLALLGALAVSDALALADLMFVFAGAVGLALVGAAVALKRRPEIRRVRLATDVSFGEFLKVGVPWVGAVVLGYVVSQAGLLVVALNNPMTETAIYGAATRLSLWLAAPTTIMVATLPPFIVRVWARNDMQHLERILRYSATVTAIPTAVAVVLVAIAGESILGVIFGSAYSAGAPYLVVLGIGYMLVAFAGPSALLLSLTGGQRAVWWTSLVVAGSVASALLAAGGMGEPLRIAIIAASGMAVLNGVLSFIVYRRMGIRPWITLSVADLDRIRRSIRSGFSI